MIEIDILFKLYQINNNHSSFVKNRWLKSFKNHCDRLVIQSMSSLIEHAESEISHTNCYYQKNINDCQYVFISSCAPYNTSKSSSLLFVSWLFPVYKLLYHSSLLLFLCIVHSHNWQTPIAGEESLQSSKERLHEQKNLNIIFIFWLSTIFYTFFHSCIMNSPMRCTFSIQAHKSRFSFVPSYNMMAFFSVDCFDSIVHFFLFD